MRNSIDKSTYDQLFTVVTILGILLLIVNIFLFFSADQAHQSFLNFSTSIMCLLLAISTWLRLEFLKVFKVARYKARRVPMWASVFVFAFIAIWRLF